MKVIITGATGYLGQEVLQQCAAHEKIDEVVTLVRRDLPAEFKDHPKITVVKVTDFGKFSDDTLKQLEGADGCIWTLGSKSPTQEPDVETLKRVNVEWPIGAAETFSSAWTLPEGRKFRFIMTSGVAIPDPDKLDQKLWFGEEMRKLRTHADIGLLKLAKEGKIEALIGKPAFITNNFSFSGVAISKKVLTASYIDSLLIGFKKEIMTNSDMRIHGQQVLQQQA